MYDIRCFNRPFINANNVSNLALVGNGEDGSEIGGSGQEWWKCKQLGCFRPHLMVFNLVRGLHIMDLKLTNPANHFIEVSTQETHMFFLPILMPCSRLVGRVPWCTCSPHPQRGGYSGCTLMIRSAFAIHIHRRILSPLQALATDGGLNFPWNTDGINFYGGQDQSLTDSIITNGDHVANRYVHQLQVSPYPVGFRASTVDHLQYPQHFASWSPSIAVTVILSNTVA
jgi:hypothetical protein